jgi:hypothetical protein
VHHDFDAHQGAPLLLNEVADEVDVKVRASPHQTHE